MPPKKRSNSFIAKAAKGNKARGSGSQSRIVIDFEKLREAGWTITREERMSSSGLKVYFRYINPAGKTLKSSRDVERQLTEEGTLERFQTMQENENVEDELKSQPGTSKLTDTSSEDPDYEPPQKKFDGEIKCERINVAEGLFVATTSSIVNFVTDFNRYFKCPSENGKCKGKLVLVASEKKGLGGAMKFIFSCSGCWKETLNYQSSQLALHSKRHLVSLALSLAFFISGHGYASYRKTLGKGLGLGVLSDKPFLEVIDLAFPHIRDILDEMCEEEKENMKALPDSQLGSWSRGVTTCDGCWQIRGHFSQNCTFVIKNYLTGGLLYYGHLSMRGADKICNDELWQGTSKAAEGNLAQVLWGKAKDEGFIVEVNWQDADSSSAKGFRYSFSNEQESKIMLCGGHVGRAHGKKLLELQTKSSFSRAFIDSHKKDYPEMEKLKCCCTGKKHTYVASRNKPSCGCLSAAFIQSAKRNHYCALVQAGRDPDKYRETMLCLGKYHSRDIHEWEGGSCQFHPLKKCSCNECASDVEGFYEDLQCDGEPYHSAHVLKCEFHALCYEIECSSRAAEAEKVIDPGLGKGHSNLPESTFSVLTKFRAKDVNLHQKHYYASTNLGLLQANMTWCFRKKGPRYHWIVELYSRLGLPLLDGIQEMCTLDNEDRMKRLERKKSQEGKKNRVKSKINRTEEQALRKKYVKNCQIRHSYGDEEQDDPCNEEAALLLTETAIAQGTARSPPTLDTVPAPEGANLELGGKCCKWCGSKTHLRKSHKDCPFNKNV